MLPSIRKILYATDISEGARLAMRYAATIAERFDAPLTILHTLPDTLEIFSEEAGIDIAETFGQEAADWINQGDQANASKAIKERLSQIANEEFGQGMASRLAQANIKIASGDAATSIVHEAKEGDYSMIIMGTHGHGRIMSLVLGSVAAEVIRHSHIPVLVTPLPDLKKDA